MAVVAAAAVVAGAIEEEQAEHVQCAMQHAPELGCDVLDRHVEKPVVLMAYLVADVEDPVHGAAVDAQTDLCNPTYAHQN
jgi:hypothetical protein